MQDGSEPQPILLDLCSQGFGGVEEECLIHVHDDLGLDVPDIANAEVEYETELALSLMQHLVADWTDVQVSQALHQGFLLNNPEAFQECSVPESSIKELTHKTDHQQIQDFYAKIRGSNKARQKHVEKRSKALSRYFKKEGTQAERT